MREIIIDYDVKIRIVCPDDDNEKVKEEIWVDIFNSNDDNILKELIWWKDDRGISHDESSNLPIKFRDIVDNAWISSIKKL